MITRRIASAALAVIVLGALAACSDSSAGQSDATTASRDTASGATLTKDNVAEEIRVAQAAAGSAHVEATVESQGQSMTLSGDVAHLDTPQTPAFDFSADVGSEKLRLRVVDQVLYVAGGALSGPGGKPWMKIDVSDPTNPISQIFQAANPGNFAAYLDGVTSFEDKGEETVDGVSAHHYVVTVDTAEMLRTTRCSRGRTRRAWGCRSQSPATSSSTTPTCRSRSRSTWPLPERSRLTSPTTARMS